MDVIVAASSEDSIQESVRLLLGEEYLLASARTLPQLLNVIVEQPVDVVILDEFLENLDCVSVFQRLRSLSPDLTCILLTVRANSEASREMRATGIYDVVAKPFDRDILLASVARAVERARLRQQLQALKSAEPHPPSRPAHEPSASGVAVGQRREVLESLRKFLKAVSDVFVPERLYSLVLDAVIEMLAINKAVLLLYNEKTQRMQIEAAVGLDPADLNKHPISPWANLVSWLKRYDQILNMDDPNPQIAGEELLSIRKELDLLQSRVCVPLAARGRLTGILLLGRKVTGRRLSDEDFEFLYLLSQHIAAIIENARRHRAAFVLKERFEGILQSVNSGLIATDSEGRLIAFNKAAEQILGLNASEVIGHNVQKMGSVFADIVFRTLREEKSFCRQEMVDPATKSHLGISTSLLTDTAGKPVGAVMIFTDLSTVKPSPGTEGEEDWQRCALCLAQEIKNPLVAIRTFTQLVPESYNDEKFRTEFSEIALKEIDKLDRVVERLLRYSQPLEIRPEPGDIHSLLEDALEQTLENFGKTGISIKKVFHLANGLIPFDRNLLNEAVIQILNNALEAMPSGGVLTVTTGTKRYPGSHSFGAGKMKGTVAEIQISDTGAGISEEEMPSLFKPFHTSKVKGMGLGLAISRRIIRGHKGDITVSSEPNKGTLVRLMLPQGAPKDA